MHVRNRPAVQLELSLVRIDYVAGQRAATLQKRRGDKWLERRAGLEGFRQRGVRERCVSHPIAREGENLAGVRIHDDNVAAIRAEAVYRDRQLALADFLQGVVDRQHHRGARSWLFGPGIGIVHRAPTLVARKAYSSRVAAQSRIQRELETVERITLAVEAANDASDTARMRINPLQHWRQMHTVQLRQGSDVGLVVEAGQVYPSASALYRRANDCCI